MEYAVYAPAAERIVSTAVLHLGASIFVLPHRVFSLVGSGRTRRETDSQSSVRRLGQLAGIKNWQN
jgi:hypothetical protein